MKKYNQTNFFKHTFCEFQQVDNFEIPKETQFKSTSGSFYYYTKEGVYRKSNHWGRVANCRWKLITDRDYNNQQIALGFAKWEYFYPLNETEKIFFISVNFKTKTTKINIKKNEENFHLFTLATAQKKIKQIKLLFREDKWGRYFVENIEELRIKIISKLIDSDMTLQQIKMNFK